MRIVRALRSAPVYGLLKLAVVIYALAWLGNAGDMQTSGDTPRNVAIVAIAVIVWGRLRNLLIRIHPLPGESIARDVWLLQLYPRALAIGIIWIAASEQADELRAEYLVAVFAMCFVLFLRPLPIVNTLIGLVVAAVGLGLMFIGDSYYHPSDSQLITTGVLLVLLGLEATLDNLIHFMGRTARIESAATREMNADKERVARKRRWEGKTPSAVMTMQQAEDWDRYKSDLDRAHPNPTHKWMLEELQLQITARDLRETLEERGLYPGAIDFPFDAVPLEVRRELSKSIQLRNSGYGFQPARIVTNGEGSIVGASDVEIWRGSTRWAIDDLEKWKNDWIKSQSTEV